MKSSNCFLTVITIILGIISAGAITFAICSKIFDKKYITVTE